MKKKTIFLGTAGSFWLGYPLTDEPAPELMSLNLSQLSWLPCISVFPSFFFHFFFLSFFCSLIFSFDSFFPLCFFLYFFLSFSTSFLICFFLYFFVLIFVLSWHFCFLSYCLSLPFFFFFFCSFFLISFDNFSRLYSTLLACILLQKYFIIYIFFLLIS